MSIGAVELCEATFRITAPDAWDHKPYKLQGLVEHISMEFEVTETVCLSQTTKLVTLRFDNLADDLRPLINAAARIDELLGEYREEADA